jgi:hypothetical protein
MSLKKEFKQMDEIEKRLFFISIIGFFLGTYGFFFCNIDDKFLDLALFLIIQPVFTGLLLICSKMYKKLEDLENEFKRKN